MTDQQLSRLIFAIVMSTLAICISIGMAGFSIAISINNLPHLKQE